MTPVPLEGQRGLHPALSMRQGVALLEEASSVRNLMRDSIHAIRQMRYVHVNGDAVFTLGSIGVEKAMKVMLGCAAVAAVGAWPSMDTLRDWGHDIEGLSTRVLAVVDEGVELATATGYAGALRDRMRGSTLLPLVFATFARYGRSGRFHHLNILATDRPGEYDEPSEYWKQVELHVRRSHFAFDEVPYGDNAALDAYERKLRDVIADEMDVWWFCLHRLGAQGCFGDLGKVIGWEIWDRGRPKPSQLRR